MQLEVTLEGEKQVSRRLLIVADGIQNFEPPLRSIGSELQKTFQDNFTQQGALFGGWPARKKDYPWPILNKTGRMRQGFRQNLGKTELLLYNTVPYFKYHQSNKPRTKLPRRVMMKIDNDRKLFIVKTFQQYIVGLIRGR
jgi:phage gpG-like protein